MGVEFSLVGGLEVGKFITWGYKLYREKIKTSFLSMFSSNVLVLLKTKSVKRIFKYDGVQVAHYLNQDIVVLVGLSFESASLTRQVTKSRFIKVITSTFCFVRM